MVDDTVTYGVEKTTRLNQSVCGDEKNTMAEKKPILYASCVFCGRQRPLATINPEKWKEVDAYRWSVVSMRYRGDGQRGGFVVDPKQSLTMRRAMRSKDPQVKALLEAHKARLLEILACYLDIKFLTREDIEGLLE